MKPSVIVIAGPTASGKSSRGIEVAQTLGGEIISADSMQVYRGMDIGTAKVSKEERTLVPHHMIDVADPAEPFSVADYVSLARPILQDIIRRGRLPFVVGGTGFYIQALLRDLDFSESMGASEIRTAMEEEAAVIGPLALWQRLKEADPASADAIHPNNVKRVIRALEYYEETGQPISALNEAQKEKESPYRVLYLVLDLPRAKLYERIDRRVDEMLAAGLEAEVRGLLDRGVPVRATAMQGLGYKEMIEYIEERINLPEAAERIKLGSRHYAKRQITWFKREKEALWIPADTPAEEMKKLLGTAWPSPVASVATQWIVPGG